MFFLSFLLLIFISWLLWNICQNTNDALDKQTAIQYEIVSLEKRLEEVLAKLEQPKTNEVSAASSGVAVSAGLDMAITNINDSSVGELSALPRIGKALAQRIIDQRPFVSVDELMNVQGISKELLEELRPKLSV